MSPTNVEVVRSFYETSNLGWRLGKDLSDRDEPLAQSLLELFSPEIVVEGAWPGGEDFHGHEGALNLFGQFMEAWADSRNDPEELIDLGDRVVALVHFSAQGGGSGIEVDQKVAHVWDLRDGHVIRVRFYPDRAEGLKEAGIEE